MNELSHNPEYATALHSHITDQCFILLNQLLAHTGSAVKYIQCSLEFRGVRT